MRLRIEEAADVLRRSPIDRHARPDAMRGLWPDTLGERDRDYPDDRTRVARALPSPAEIARANEALGWLLWLPGPLRRLALARALGVKWRPLERRFGYSERWLRQQLMLGYVVIAVRLNGAPGVGSKNRFPNFRKFTMVAA